MASRTSQIAQIGKRKIEISNLAKVLYPADQIVKAELIEYYVKVAPTLLAHLKGRPLSLVRYPEGIEGHSFFQKNRPEWAPDWVEYVTLGEEKKDYILANEEATFAWLANLACIELHQMHSQAPNFDKPDYITYDFDPPDNFRFSDIVELALEFKEHLEGFGYSAFVKTTGRKALHVVTPIEPKWPFEKCFEAAKLIAQPFVESHGSALTLHIKKEMRKGKILLDIYRNRSSQTIVAPYSLRGLPGAPVSMPLRWEELDELESSQQFNIRNAHEHLINKGDAWEGMAAYATYIHTEKKPAGMKKRVAAARTYKTPEQLESYSQKRSFEKTSEPIPQAGVGEGHAFVVHRHHATRLHYDLRLEMDGVLKSWAVPKGLPPRPGIMRLAVNVEDHPLEYVKFEGAIPKGEYGGGMMWKYAQGRYQITKQKPEGFYFRLQSPELSGEYRIHRTKENQWLLERVDNPQVDWLAQKVDPMLAKPIAKPPKSDDYVFEVKWDGIRAVISLDEGKLRIRGRNGLDITEQFPELLIPEDAFRANCGVFDGEIVCLESDGRPNFRDVIFRMQQRSPGAIDRARGKHPAVCYLFDCLYLDGRSILNERLIRRREWLVDAVKAQSVYRVSDAVEDGETFLEAVKAMNLEGVMAKLKTSNYVPGKRSDCWLKIKTHKSIECIVIGYTTGKGDREASFGALYLAQMESGTLKYIGKVGSGFDDTSMKEVAAELKKLNPIARPIKEKPLDAARAVWVECKLVCEVQFTSLTSEGLLREPVFLRLRPDLAALNS